VASLDSLGAPPAAPALPGTVPDCANAQGVKVASAAPNTKAKLECLVRVRSFIAEIFPKFD
jgi:hypothetical protein